MSPLTENTSLLTWGAYAFYFVAIAAILGTVYWFRLRRQASEDLYERLLEEQVRDRTSELEERNEELQILNAQLLEASLTDSLTGLHNRRFFFEQVAKDIALARRRHHLEAATRDRREGFDLGFLMVDLDYFKSVNDAFGHTAGDHVLVEVRSILLDCCRASDIVIRWGGDEFLVLARDTDGDRAINLAERIRQAVKNGIFRLGNGKMLRTTCSIGLAHYPFVRTHPSAVGWEQVVQLADSAMYQAKRTRDAWVAYSSTHSTLRRDSVISLSREAPEELIREGRLRVLRSTNSAVATASG